MFFRRIADLRVDSDLTQRAVAAYLNMNLEVYRRYEKGVREIPVWALLKLAELYHQGMAQAEDLLPEIIDYLEK